MANKKVWSPSEIQKQVLEIIRENKGDTLIYADLKKVIPTLNPSHLTSLVKNGLLEVKSVERLIITESLKEVNSYVLTEKESE